MPIVKATLSSSFACKLWKECKDISFSNHADCFASSLGKCTTDVDSSCMDLKSCADYDNSAACYVDKGGVITKKESDGRISIVFNGECIWRSNKCE